jgi:hypothetical protein
MAIGGAKSAVIAKTASSGSNTAIAVWTGKTSINAYFLNATAIFLLIMVGQRMKTARIAPGVYHRFFLQKYEFQLQCCFICFEVKKQMLIIL